MKLVKVTSTHIKAIGWEADFRYDTKKPKKNTLRVQFNNDAVYDYLDVSERTFKDFLEANSKGAFFERKIKNRYVTLKRRIKVKDE